MKKGIVGILIAVVLVLGIVACAPPPNFFDSIVVYGAESSNTTWVEGSIMAVFYAKADEQVIFWCVTAQIIDRGDGKWDIYSPQGTITGMSQTTVEYGLYSYEPLPNPQSQTYYLDDLDLQDITWQDLPYEQHIGKLMDVNPSQAKPAMVRRWYMGKIYDVPCLVEQDVVDMWIADTLNIGDWVHTSFIIEIPNSTERHIAIVTGKVYESW